MDQTERTPNDQPRPFMRGRALLRDKLQGKVFIIPSLVTVTALFCGFLAIIRSFQGEYVYATVCIGLAIILDGLDGRVARRLNATSAFGREFDSLSDVIAFGVAPGVLVYQWGFASLADEFGILVAFVFVACGATRLARFNVTTTSEAKAHFQGLPIPGAAAAMASIVYLAPTPLRTEPAVLAMLLYMLMVAAFMVSTIPFLSVKHVRITPKNPRRNLAVLALAVALVWYNSRVAIMLLSNAYALSGPIQYLLRKRQPKKVEVTGAAEDGIQH
jgi:CDP-diacylglycerol---serine O-phosphatidyltransferase